MTYLITIIFGLLLILFHSNEALARAFRVGQLPNGSKLGCISCHNSQNGGDSRNPFGKEVGTKFLINGNVEWGPELAKLDSDGDGFTNGEELQDPNGEWRIGNPPPGNPDLVKNPGDPNSKPDVNGIIDAVQAMNDIYELNIAQNINFSEIIISYNLNTNSKIILEILDINGSVVKILEKSDKSTGKHINNWDGRDATGATIPAGVYFVRLTTAENSSIKKFIFNR